MQQENDYHIWNAFLKLFWGFNVFSLNYFTISRYEEIIVIY